MSVPLSLHSRARMQKISNYGEKKLTRKTANSPPDLPRDPYVLHLPAHLSLILKRRLTSKDTHVHGGGGTRGKYTSRVGRAVLLAAVPPRVSSYLPLRVGGSLPTSHLQGVGTRLDHFEPNAALVGELVHKVHGKGVGALRLGKTEHKVPQHPPHRCDHRGEHH